MSIDRTEILFEGFLQKRKDTLKIRWVTYWFRLQNTTMFFYTKKNGSASHLRGYYYIHTVQSVREVLRTNSKRFVFEIIMTNGKRKTLGAETADLRKEWVEHLWQAMHLSTSMVPPRDTHLEEWEQKDRPNSSEPMCSPSGSVMESLPARPLSAPAPPVQIHSETRSTTFALNESQEDSIYLNIPSAFDSVSDPQWSSGLSKSEDREGDYDVLPVRNKICEISVSTETDEDLYDFPLSYRSAEHQDPDSIYDVPSSLLRNMADDIIEEQKDEELYCMVQVCPDGPV